MIRYAPTRDLRNLIRTGPRRRQPWIVQVFRQFFQTPHHALLLPRLVQPVKIALRPMG